MSRENLFRKSDSLRCLYSRGTIYVVRCNPSPEETRISLGRTDGPPCRDQRALPRPAPPRTQPSRGASLESSRLSPTWLWRCFGSKSTACASLEHVAGPRIDVCGMPLARYRATEVDLNWSSVKLTSPATGLGLVRRGNDLDANEGQPYRCD